MLVGADGLDADIELGGDIAGSLAGGDEAHDLEFAGGEIGMGDRRGVAVGGGAIGEVSLAGQDTVEGFDEDGALGVLGDVAGSA